MPWEPLLFSYSLFSATVFTESQDCKAGGTPGGHPAQIPSQSWIKLPNIWTLRISKDGDFFQCSTTLTLRKLFLKFNQHFLFFSSLLLPLVLSPGNTEKYLTVFISPISYYALIRSLWALSSAGWAVESLSLFPYNRCFSLSNIFVVLLWGFPRTYLPLVLENPASQMCLTTHLARGAGSPTSTYCQCFF